MPNSPEAVAMGLLAAVSRAWDLAMLQGTGEIRGKSVYGARVVWERVEVTY